MCVGGGVGCWQYRVSGGEVVVSMSREGIGSRRYVNSLVQVRWCELQTKWEAVSYSWDSFHYQYQCRVLLDKGSVVRC